MTRQWLVLQSIFVVSKNDSKLEHFQATSQKLEYAHFWHQWNGSKRRTLITFKSVWRNTCPSCPMLLQQHEHIHFWLQDTSPTWTWASLPRQGTGS